MYHRQARQKLSGNAMCITSSHCNVNLRQTSTRVVWSALPVGNTHVPEDGTGYRIYIVHVKYDIAEKLLTSPKCFHVLYSCRLIFATHLCLLPVSSPNSRLNNCSSGHIAGDHSTFVIVYYKRGGDINVNSLYCIVLYKEMWSTWKSKKIAELLNTFTIIRDRQDQWCKQDQILKTKTTGSNERHLADLTFK